MILTILKTRKTRDTSVTHVMHVVNDANSASGANGIIDDMKEAGAQSLLYYRATSNWKTWSADSQGNKEPRSQGANRAYW